MIPFQPDHFIQSLPQDPSLDEYPRAVQGALYSFTQPKKTAFPQKIHLNTNLLKIHVKTIILLKYCSI